jgi:hypothetical protein
MWWDSNLFIGDTGFIFSKSAQVTYMKQPKKINPKQKYVLCWSCHKPIHLSEFGGVMRIDGKEAFIHDNIVCLIQATEAQKKKKHWWEFWK